MRVVLDTNVLIAAALKEGLARDIIRMVTNTDLLILIVSEGILEELHRKLISKFKWAEERVDYFLESLREISEITKVAEKIEVIIRDPDDNKILECALAGKADLIVSSDQDLIKLKTFKGIGIIHPKTLSWTLPEYFKKNQS